MSTSEILKRRILLHRQAVILLGLEFIRLMRKHLVVICVLSYQLFVSHCLSLIKKTVMAANGYGLLGDQIVKWIFRVMDLKGA